VTDGSPAAPWRSLLLRRLALVAVATLVALLIGEAACRVLSHLANQQTLDVAFSTRRHVEEGQRVALIDILQMSTNDRIIFELKRGMRDVPFKGAPFSTNSHGFRGPEVEVAEGPDTVTIVGLGDSVMFGYGVADERPYLAVLERHLNHKYPQKRWRCINTAAPAYNTVMEVETLRSRALAFGPDLVILGLVSNDLVLPPYMRAEVDVFDPGRSFLFERLLAGTRWADDRNGFDLREGRDARLVFRSGLDEAPETPERYKNMTGWEPFRAALGDLQSMAAEHGFRVVTFTNTEDDTTERMTRLAAEHHWPHVTLLPEIQRYLREHGGGEWSPERPEAYLASKLAVAPDDGHPSPMQHQLAAAKLLNELERQGLIAELLAR